MIGVIKRIILCCGLAFFSLSAYAGATINDMNVTMRNSGYVIGDLMKMRATFTLPAHQTIDEESLPLMGRVNHWLDIQAIDLAQNKQTVQLDITWQLFATVEIVQRLKTPEIVLKTNGAVAQKIIIPPQAFYYSPVLPMSSLKGIKRHANLVPLRFDTVKPLIYLSVCLALLILCSLAWLWLKDLLPWYPYRPGPMTQLARKLKGQTTALSLTELREIHTALNKSAGISLYPIKLSTLFNHAPYFANEQNNVTQFYMQSWVLFYSDQRSAQGVIDRAHTVGWVQRVAMAERIFRRKLKA